MKPLNVQLWYIKCVVFLINVTCLTEAMKSNLHGKIADLGEAPNDTKH